MTLSAVLIDEGIPFSLDPIIQALCADIAEEATYAVVDYMQGEVANEGQETLINQVMDVAAEAASATFWGQLWAFEANHMEAVGEIIEEANGIVYDAWQEIQDLRDEDPEGDE